MLWNWLLWGKPLAKPEAEAEKPVHPEKATVCAPALVLRGSTRQSPRAHHLTRPPFAAALAQATLISWDAATTAVVPIVVAFFGYLITREFKLASFYFGEKHTKALAEQSREQTSALNAQTSALDAQTSALNAQNKEQTSALNALHKELTSALNAQHKELTSALNVQNKELIAAMVTLKTDAFDHQMRTTILETKRSMAPAAYVAAAPARQMHHLRRRLRGFSAISSSARRLASLARLA